MKRSLSILLLLLLSQTAVQAAVWETKHQWDDAWEERFSQWVSTGLTQDIFMNGKYGGIKHDRADSAYFTRLIFAYENGLPFVILDPRFRSYKKEKVQIMMPKTGDMNSPYNVVTRMISSEMRFYDALEPERRFRRFINLVGDVVGSNSLFNDTYPVQLDRRWFRPGVVAGLPRAPVHAGGPNPFFFEDNGPNGAAETAGHSQIVVGLDSNGVIRYLKSTVPAQLRLLQPTTLNIFVPHPRGGSFRYWKQPQHYKMRDEQIPGYGTEQYEIKGIFEDEVQKRFALTEETRDQKLGRLAGEVCSQVAQRVPVVNEAWQYKATIGARCMDFKEFDSYSTPSRDGKIKKALGYLVTTATEQRIRDARDVGQVAKYLNQACGDIEYLPGKKISAAKFAERLLAGKVSADPNQNPAVRWGDQDEAALGCQQFY
ncbi:MAG: hypothetical protein A2286_02020 [Gammaproteobacteria bacterium RIFOXYA12_FULL_61_12]|nr:MAG: hypothetical protein A2286_02020 [Gammaproteobacteria bacterium RIFOXYA12_FULL_61_12]